jgi:hypothetical protein
MLLDRRNIAPHFPWIVLVVMVTVAGAGWYVATGLTSARWPGGSSLPGLVFGTLAATIIVFEFLLWPRKMLRTWRIGRVQTWLRAHIWLGLLCVPLALLHGGFRLGGELSAILMIVLFVVVASGAIGLALQQFLPRLMFERVPAETIYSEIDHFAQNLHDGAEEMVLVACGEERGEAQGAAAGPRGGADRKERRTRDGRATPFVTVGAVRSVGSIQGKVLQTAVAADRVPGAEALREFFYDSAAPFLLQGAKSGSPLSVPSKAGELFRRLRTQLSPPAHPTIDALEGMCEQRRQLDTQSRIHFWLHGWLWVHLPLSALLLVLLVVHIVYALKYW